MISMENLFKVAEAMLPLYIPLGLGYASFRWWRLISLEQFKAIDHLVFFITLPLFTFQFTLDMDPFAMNYRMIGADAISKVLVAGLLLVAWTSCRLWLGHRGQERPNYCRAITIFSLTQFTNSPVVGLPLVKAMYGSWGGEVVAQLSVVQAVLWLPLLQSVFELRKARCGLFYQPSEVQMASIEAPFPPGTAGERAELAAAARPSSGSLIKTVLLSLAKNPNSYASIIGIAFAWAFLSNRWHLETPEIIKKSIHIMSDAGPGMAMFSLGLFVASQEKILTCGPRLTAYAMALKFISGPAAMAIGAFSIGLRGDLLHLAIIQAALPQSLTAFMFAKEYDLDADILSTAVTFGMLVSLPVLVLFSVILGHFY